MFNNGCFFLWMNMSVFGFVCLSLLWPLSLTVRLLNHVEVLSSQSAVWLKVSDGTQRICLSVTAHVPLFNNNKLSKSTHVSAGRRIALLYWAPSMSVCVCVCALLSFHFSILHEHWASVITMADSVSIHLSQCVSVWCMGITHCCYFKYCDFWCETSHQY